MALVNNRELMKKRILVLRLLITPLIVGLVFISVPPSFVTAQQTEECSEAQLQNNQVAMLSCTGASSCQASSSIGGNLDRFLQVLAFQESRGNPTAQAGTSSASGKYQYINSTWKARAKIYGPSGQYARAKDAPEEVQDAVAFIEYAEKFNNNNGDLFRLAVNHYLPAALTNEALLDRVPAGGNKFTPREYANKLIENVGKGVGADIQLRYQQAPEFNTWIEKVGGIPGNQGASVTINSGGSACGPNAGNQANASKIVEIAQRELAAGANEADGSYFKYTGGVSAQWCAYFVSWVLREAGRPFEENNGVFPAVAQILAYSKSKGYFYSKNDPSFKPQPGDIALYKEGVGPYPSHTNIVISYNPADNTFVSIGGNESNKVKQAVISAQSPALTGFMRLP
jgi:hypothetical protein